MLEALAGVAVALVTDTSGRLHSFSAILRTSSPNPLTVAGLEILPAGQGATVAPIP
jgi:hypothetical protein